MRVAREDPAAAGCQARRIDGVWVVAPRQCRFALVALGDDGFGLEDSS
jgi:hypothetical protein